MGSIYYAGGEALGEVACVAGSEDCCAWGTFLAAYAKRAAKLLKENKRLLARLVHQQRLRYVHKGNFSERLKRSEWGVTKIN